MDNIIAIVFGIAIITGWVAICIAVGKAAEAKGRRRGLWSFMSFTPLGPILAPLFLASLPVVGEKPTTGQIIGRTVLFAWLGLSILANFASKTIVAQADKETVSKAAADYGIETEFVSTHYRKMSVDEIVECVTLAKTIEQMEYDADHDEANETFFFETQNEADIYNDLVAKNITMECDERTYDVSDLERAMKIIEGDTGS